MNVVNNVTCLFNNGQVMCSHNDWKVCATFRNILFLPIMKVNTSISVH